MGAAALTTSTPHNRYLAAVADARLGVEIADLATRDFTPAAEDPLFSDPRFNPKTSAAVNLANTALDRAARLFGRRTAGRSLTEWTGSATASPTYSTSALS